MPKTHKLISLGMKEVMVNLVLAREHEDMQE